MVSILAVLAALFKSSIRDLERTLDRAESIFATSVDFILRRDQLSRSQETILSSQDIANRIGVNIHLQYLDSAYSDKEMVISALKYTGLNLVRDFPPTTSAQLSRAYALADENIRYDFFLQGDLSPLKQVELLEAHRANAVAAIEGPNEINNFPVHFNGTSGEVAAYKFQDALFQQVRQSRELKDKPVYMMSGVGRSQSADFVNLHTYTHRDENPALRMLKDLNLLTGRKGRTPFVVTETGYFTSSKSVGWGGVDEFEQAQLVLEQLLDSMKLGAQAFYIYELSDSYSDPSVKDQERHFGLFRQDWKPKRAAITLRNFLNLMRSGTAVSPATALRATTSCAQTLVTQSGPGRYKVMIWRDPHFFRQPRVCTVNFDRSLKSALVYTPTLSAKPDIATSNVTAITVSSRQMPAVLDLQL